VNYLITFHHTFFDYLDRIHQNKGRIRRSKIDYLFYSLFDAIVEEYMVVLDKVGTKIEVIEDHLMKNLSRNTLETIYDLKREMLFFRGSIAPLKEIITRLHKDEETQIIQESTYIFFEDLLDHVVQVNDTIYIYREMLASFIVFYMMLNSNAMNEVMKTLTIISTIFIPLTFIGTVYGMNFDHMPEIQWKYGYFVVLVCMLALTLVMLSFFKRKKWF
jgi:magnesium transporter